MTEQTIDPITGELLETPATVPAEALLSEYENMASMVDDLRTQLANALAAIVPSEVQAEMEAIQAEQLPRIEAGERKLAEIKTQLAAAVKNYGKTLTGDVFQAQYVSPGWSIGDIKGLLAYAAQGHPEVMRFLKPTEPSTRIVMRRGAK